MDPKPRFVLHETKERPHATRDIAEAAGLSQYQVWNQVIALNERLKATLKLNRDPITVSGSGSWRVDGAAGLLRLNNQVEIEVVPKFLNPQDSTWRADFFLLAVLVRTGHLLVGDEIEAGIQDRGDLATLVARSLLHMHSENQRRPIRGYERVSRSDFSFDGEVEWDTLLLPESDGFRLHRLELTRRNDHNAVLRGAVDALDFEVGDGDTRAQLQRLARRLGDQAPPRRTYAHLPQRHSAWKQAYSLSQLVLEGMGLDLRGGTLSGPGFVLSTWSAWETLCEAIVRRVTPGSRTVGQHPFPLGVRGDGTPVSAKPDIAVLKDGVTRYLIDAKYKTRQGRKPSISSTDLYESLAFMRAAKTDCIVLLYPSLDSTVVLPLGGWKHFDDVRVDKLRVQAAQVQVRGLAQRGGFDRLVEGARGALGVTPATASDE
jgi:5-methylcytosine-specific restriction enzyme subunit McrC